MNYSNDPSMVRVDFFKSSGKWYTTEQMKWLQYNQTPNKGIHDIFLESLKLAFPYNYGEFDAICLEPYHEHSHPIQIKLWYPNQPSNPENRIIPHQG